MIETKQYHVEELIDQAMEQVNQTKRVHLVSITTKIDSINMLQLFSNAKQTGKNRTYWSSTDDDFTIVGIGSSYDIQTQNNHYAATQQEWLALLQRSFIYNPYGIDGTGVVALGGMTFDPNKQQTKLWENYGVSFFHVPTYAVVENKGSFYMTVTHAIDKGVDKASVVASIDSAEEMIQQMTYAADECRQGDIIHKEEIGTKRWLHNVEQAIQFIKEEHAKKIVLAREMRIRLNKTTHIGHMLKKLHELQTNCYIYAFERGEDCFIGATPERLVRIEGERMLSTCLAGTAPRGKTSEEDEQIGAALLHDAKNLEEHGYVVQMIADAITPYCTDIEIANQPSLRPLKNLQHLYTPVTATIKPEYHIFDLVESLHPTPALGGLPNDVALAFLREHEQLDRGWYGAPIGWMDSNQHGEFAVGIRSALVQDDEISLFAGCGVMRDSDPQEEYEETGIKFLPILSVLED